jgi:hypothetical protein
VAALATRGVDGERLFGFGERYSWFQVRELLARLYATNDNNNPEDGSAARGRGPGYDIPPVRYCGVDQTDVPNQRAEHLIRGLGLGQERGTSLEESVRASAESFFSLDDDDGGAAFVWTFG